MIITKINEFGCVYIVLGSDDITIGSTKTSFMLLGATVSAANYIVSDCHTPLKQTHKQRQRTFTDELTKREQRRKIRR